MGSRQLPRPVMESPEPPGARRARSYVCDACGKRFDGEPAGRGLYVSTRGDEVRFEEPPLCERCADAIGLAALAQWEIEEDGE